MKKIALLGSTGSIGTSTLDIARHLKEEIAVVALAARENIDLLEKQIEQFSPRLVGVYNEAKAKELQARCPHVEVMPGMEGLKAVAACSEANFVMSAIAGTMGLEPTLAALEAGKCVGLANKEALVSGGELVMGMAKEKGVDIIPVDSEHSAIFQCLNGEKHEEISRIILTASGGPFRNFSLKQLKEVTVQQALNHPNWSMGAKVTIDSSTLMNKGLETIEAHWLFQVSSDKIEVIIHPQSIVHSAVEFVDRSCIAQLGDPDMRTPIQYALTYPHRKKGILNAFDFLKNSHLEFSEPDLKKFPCLGLAFEAMNLGKSYSCYMNAANEVLVHRFIHGEIRWDEIGGKLASLMERHEGIEVNCLDSVLEVDEIARREAAQI